MHKVDAAVALRRHVWLQFVDQRLLQFEDVKLRVRVQLLSLAGILGGFLELDYYGHIRAVFALVWVVLKCVLIGQWLHQWLTLPDVLLCLQPLVIDASGWPLLFFD